MSSGCVLIVCGKQDFANEIASFVISDGFLLAESALSVNEARRKLSFLEPDLIIISLPLSDDPGVDFITDVAERTDAGIIALVRPEVLSGMQYVIEQAGALVIPKPVNRMILKQTVRFALNSRKSIKGLKIERDDLQKRMEERKLVEKAKWLLVENADMTEPDAHRYIQKQAMNSRISQLRVARDIIKNYDVSNENSDGQEL